jgi:hypothetical protein
MTAIPAILAALCLHPSASSTPPPYASTRTLKDLSFSTPLKYAIETCPNRVESASNRVQFASKPAFAFDFSG